MAQGVPFFRPDIGSEEIQEVVSALESGWLTTGPKVKTFEEEFARAVGAEHAIAVNSCTAALHLAVEALGLRPGEAVVVPTMTFAATAEVVRYLGAYPLLVDCEPGTLNLDLEDAGRKIRAFRAGEIPGAPSGGTPLVALQTLYEIIGLIGAGHGLDQVLDSVLDLMLGIVRAARGLIILIDENTGALEVRTSRGVEKETAQDATQYSESIVRAAGAGTSILSTDAAQDERFSRSRSISLFQIRSLMCVPLKVRQKTIGTVYVDGGGTGGVVLGSRETYLNAYLGCPEEKVNFQPGNAKEYCDLVHFWSLHHGGGNFAFADGSVRFLSYTANDVLVELSTRDGGETLPKGF